jgi:RNA polymerase sigma-70 factor (ECF subfamily)
MTTPLQTGRPAGADTAQASEPAREFLRPVLVSDAALEEQRLIESVKSGDSAAFGALITRYLPRALSLGMRILRHREDAEDLVQDAFLSALKHIDNFDPCRPFWPWLSRIIVNRGLDLSASRAVRQSEALDDRLADRTSSPVHDAERSDFFAHVREAMLTLPPRRRLVVELFELEGFSIVEIAEHLDSAPSTIRWHLHIGRRQLRSALAHVRGVSA